MAISEDVPIDRSCPTAALQLVGHTRTRFGRSISRRGNDCSRSGADAVIAIRRSVSLAHPRAARS